MSPEILKRNEYNTKTDIYSIGLVIYQLSVICTSDKITKIYQGLLKNRNYVVEELEREKIPKILATIITNLVCFRIPRILKNPESWIRNPGFRILNLILNLIQ
jgi:serine/threonine protein kinase